MLRSTWTTYCKASKRARNWGENHSYRNNDITSKTDITWDHMIPAMHPVHNNMCNVGMQKYEYAGERVTEDKR